MPTRSSEAMKTTPALSDAALAEAKANNWDPGEILHPSKIDPATLARVQAIWACMSAEWSSEAKSSDDERPGS